MWEILRANMEKVNMRADFAEDLWYANMIVWEKLAKNAKENSSVTTIEWNTDASIAMDRNCANTENENPNAEIVEEVHFAVTIGSSTHAGNAEMNVLSMLPFQR